MIFSVSTIMAPVTSRRPSFHARPLAVLMWLRAGGDVRSASEETTAGVVRTSL